MKLIVASKEEGKDDSMEDGANSSLKGENIDSQPQQLRIYMYMHVYV